MVIAKNLDEILNDLSKKHSVGEEYILGIVQAQYTKENVKKIIKDYYNIWDKQSGKFIDFYWLGYGKYLPDREQTDDKIILDYPFNNSNKYYDEDKYVEGLSAIKQLTGKDFHGINLFLFQCEGDKIIGSRKALRINISKLIKKDIENLEQYVDCVFKTAKTATDLQEFKKRYNFISLREGLKQINIIELINLVISVYGAVK